MRSKDELLSGWGRTSATRARVVDIDAAELVAALATEGVAEGPGGLDTGDRGLIARGLGRAYGDPAQNAGGTVVRLAPGPIHLDTATGQVRVGAGVSLDELMRHIVPRGFFVPVTPGTRFVTVGGAVASDIHGKNHHRDGSFGDHVVDLTILLADGERRTITATTDPDLWWATIGGMGLTGIILEVTVQLLAVETSRCLVDTERLPNLDALLERMAASDAEYRYSVAWVDLLATGAGFGRAVLTQGDHADLADLAEHQPKAADDPLAFSPPALAAVPPGVPNVINRFAVRAFNELWYRKAPREHRGIETITGFFHPLDMVGHWNRVYGNGGFLQYQFVVPFDQVDTLRRIVEIVVESRYASFVNVLKRMGAQSAAMLSFPRPGWTLTIDLPAAPPEVRSLVMQLDELVLGAGGRLYLAKDATTTPETFRAGYPRLDEWLRVRRAVDPDGRFVSDQARRLGLA